ncbi:MAG: hypothetical protein ABSG85_19740 [Spirochaetia bacterium]|jgi:hypothetical protein
MAEGNDQRRHAQQVEAARSVLLELARLLSEYRGEMVVVGGWVPAFLIPQDTAPHIGSIDVDLALNHVTLRDPGYRTILDLLIGRGYRQDDEQPCRFWRTVIIGERTADVEVDLLAGEYKGTARTHRAQRVQDVRARKARGYELVFQFSSEVQIDGTLPDGVTRDNASIRIASMIPVGPDALAAQFGPHVGHALITPSPELSRTSAA